jgi:uncharacterized protein YeaO (DUF488 family)
MSVRVVRLGTPRTPGEGLRLGTVRRPPRGVKKADFARLDYYDLWLPLLSPSQAVVTRAMSQPWTEARWRKFVRPAPRQLIEVLARLSHGVDFSVGCYCEREGRCHRSVLKKLFEEHGAKID